MRSKVIEGQINLFDYLNDVSHETPKEIITRAYTSLKGLDWNQCNWCQDKTKDLTICMDYKKLKYMLCQNCIPLFEKMVNSRYGVMYECCIGSIGYVFCTDNFETVQQGYKQNKSKQKVSTTLYKSDGNTPKKFFMNVRFNIYKTTGRVFKANKEHYQKLKKWRD